MAKRRKAVDPGPKASSVNTRLKRRAVVIGVLGLLSVAGVMIYDVGRGPTSHVVVLNLTEAPVTDVVLSGLGGSWWFERIEMARAESARIERAPDARYAFHLKYKQGGAVKETDVRLFAGKAAVTAVEIAVTPEGIRTSMRSEETAADRFGQFYRSLRKRIGL